MTQGVVVLTSILVFNGCFWGFWKAQRNGLISMNDFNVMLRSTNTMRMETGIGSLPVLLHLLVRVIPYGSDTKSDKLVDYVLIQP